MAAKDTGLSSSCSLVESSRAVREFGCAGRKLSQTDRQTDI